MRSLRVPVIVALGFALAACSRRHDGPLPSEASGTAASTPAFASRARAIAPLFAGGLAERYVLRASELPPVRPRIVYRDASATHTFSAAEAMKQPDPWSLMAVNVDAGSFYARRCGSPFENARPLEIAAAAGVGDVAGKRVLELGCGMLGSLWMLASLGADATGVDPDPEVRALYTGAPLPFPPAVAGGGRVTFLSSRFLSDPAVRGAVGTGYSLVLSRNTLKHGLVHGGGVDLGMDGDTFARSLFDVLAPGGLAVLYNTGGAAAPPGSPPRPEADLRSPFDRATWERAGLVVRELDRDDSAAIRRLARALGWATGEGRLDVDRDLFAAYTVLERPAPR